LPELTILRKYTESTPKAIFCANYEKVIKITIVLVKLVMEPNLVRVVYYLKNSVRLGVCSDPDVSTVICSVRAVPSGVTDHLSFVHSYIHFI
jgi:hypothetical protein